MPGVPRVIQVGPIRYRVSQEKDDLRTHLYEGRELAYSGRTIHAEQLIVLEPTEGKERQLDTMLHETLHAISCVFHLDMDESLVGRLSAPLLDVLRRNPELVEYLLAQEG